MGILLPLLLIAFTCLIIWRACDGFETASEYIGRNLSDGVRGGTINAIASSVPELFTTLIALFILEDESGFSVGIGTTTGSALFNGMIIPALCILTVVGTVILGQRVRAVNVRRKVILRDGIALIVCEFLLVLSLSGTNLYWWQGALLVGLYLAYFVYALASMSGTRALATPDAEAKVREIAAEQEEQAEAPKSMLLYWLSLGPLLDLERFFVREEQRRRIAEGTWNGWPLLLSATVVIGIACWLLVHACEWLGSGADGTSYTLFGQEFRGIGMPTMFVAVIFASAATSVPDTVIAMRDARDGDYDDAVSNALGSNIFDICFALGFPMFVYTLLHGPIRMTSEVAQLSAELRILLLALTILGFFIYLFGRTSKDATGNVLVAMGKGKAAVLLCLYGGFVAYVIGRGAQEPWARTISDVLSFVAAHLPSFG